MLFPYLYSNNPLLDLWYAADPITYRFHFRVDNSTGITRYIQIVSAITNWSVTTPSEGKLGAVDGGTTKHFDVTLSRANPGSPVDDSGQLIMKVYADSGYTNLIEENPMNVTMSTVNTKGGTYYLYDFNDGTLQGWTTNGSLATDRFMGASGYSVKSTGNASFYMSRTISIPSGAKAAGALFYKVQNVGGTRGVSRSWVTVDGVIVWDWGINQYQELLGVSETPWRKMVFNLTPYAGQSKTVRIDMTKDGGSFVFVWIDNIVIGAW